MYFWNIEYSITYITRASKDFVHMNRKLKRNFDEVNALLLLVLRPYCICIFFYKIDFASMRKENKLILIIDGCSKTNFFNFPSNKRQN